MLNYYAHPATEGLGTINTVSDSSMGLILHDTMAFTEEGPHWVYWMPSAGRETLMTEAKGNAAKKPL